MTSATGRLNHVNEGPQLRNLPLRPPMRRLVDAARGLLAYLDERNPYLGGGGFEAVDALREAIPAEGRAVSSLDLEMTDWRGTPIWTGSLVVYPVRFGSFMDVIEAEVVSLETRQQWTHSGRKQVPILTVRRLRETEPYSDDPQAKELPSKLVELTALERVTVVG